MFRRYLKIAPEQYLKKVRYPQDDETGIGTYDKFKAMFV